MTTLFEIGVGTTPVLGEEQAQATLGGTELRVVGVERSQELVGRHPLVEGCDELVEEGRASHTRKQAGRRGLVGHGAQPRGEVGRGQMLGLNLRYSTSSSRLTTNGIEPSQVSRMIASSAASSTSAETTSSPRTSSITSPVSIVSLSRVVMVQISVSSSAGSTAVVFPRAHSAKPSIGVNHQELERFRSPSVTSDTRVQNSRAAQW